MWRDLRFFNRLGRIEDQQHLVATLEEQVATGFLCKKIESEHRFVKRLGQVEITRVEGSLQNAPELQRAG